MYIKQIQLSSDYLIPANFTRKHVIEQCKASQSCVIKKEGLRISHVLPLGF